MKAPPDAPRPRPEAEGDSTNLRGSGVSAKTTTRPPIRTGLRLCSNRELVLHRTPAVAAALLVEELGPLGARAWALRLVAELDQ